MRRNQTCLKDRGTRGKSQKMLLELGFTWKVGLSSWSWFMKMSRMVWQALKIRKLQSQKEGTSGNTIQFKTLLLEINSRDIQRFLCHHRKVGQSLGLYPVFMAPNAVHRSHFSILSELHPLLILYGVISIFCEIEHQFLGNGIMLCHSLVVQLWVRDLNSENLSVSHLKEKNNAACLARWYEGSSDRIYVKCLNSGGNITTIIDIH